MASVWGRSFSVACGLKWGRRIRRASVWNGGSEVIGGATRVLAPCTGGIVPDIPGGEVLGVVGHGGDVVVAGGEDGSTPPVGVGHGALAAELVPYRVGSFW